MSEAAVNQVVDESPDAATEADAKRERSTIVFPYLGMDVAVEIAKGVHDVGGTHCQWEQLAAKLHHDAKAASFRQRVVTAKTFGFVTSVQGTVTLTPLGSRLCDPNQEASAKADAFLSVPLYVRIYEQFKGGVLPPPSALENAMVSLGVAPKQKDTARQVFQRSATEAGFFAFGANRLVLPSFKNGTTANGGEITKDVHEAPRPRKNGGDDGGDGHHPLIEGLIKALPIGGTPWPLEARRKWLQAAAMNFDFVYVDSTSSDATIRVTLDKEGSVK